MGGSHIVYKTKNPFNIQENPSSEIKFASSSSSILTCQTRNMRLGHIVLVSSLLVGCSLGMPQYGPTGGGGGGSGSGVRPGGRPQPQKQRPPPGCHFEYETIQAIEQVESFDKKCRTEQERRCQTLQREVCNPYQDQECWQDKRRQCDTKYKKDCKEYYKDKTEYYTVNECNDQRKRVCEKHWEVRGPGDKVWVDNPDKCDWLTESICADVKKEKIVKEPYTKCDDVPWQDCYDVPEQKCKQVTKQRCQNQNYQDCQNYPVQKCEDVHKLTPKQVSRRKEILVCGNKRTPTGGSGGGHSSGGHSGGRPRVGDDEEDVEVFDPRDGGSASGQADVGAASGPKSKTKIVFGERKR